MPLPNTAAGARAFLPSTKGEPVFAAIRAFTLASVAVVSFLVFRVVFRRFSYPYDLEWMTGSELDHIQRIRDGLPVYTAPSSDWIPFLYPPLYYYVVAAGSKIWGIRRGARLVSIVGTLVQGVVVHRASRQCGLSRFWSILASGLFFSAFSLVECWYDIERPDCLFVAFVLTAYLVLVETRGMVGSSLSGLLLGLSILTKQPGITFLLAAAMALVGRREFRRALGLVGTATLVVVPAVAFLQHQTGGWFGYYVWGMPKSHGIDWNLLPLLLGDLAKGWLYLVGTGAAVVLLSFGGARLRQNLVFLAFLGASVVASFASRLHIGGWTNVHLFWVGLASVAIARVGDSVDRMAAPSSGGVVLKALVPMLVALQCLQLLPDGDRAIPSEAARGGNQGLERRIRELESRGEVWVFGMGHLTEKGHPHIQALIDILHVDKRIPQAIVTDVRNQRFAAIVLSTFDDLWLPQQPAIGDQFFRVVAENYVVSEKLPLNLPDPVVGYRVHPTWVLTPRKTPVAEATTENLLRQQTAEIAIASLREEAIRRQNRLPPTAPSTEEVARSLVPLLYGE